MDCGIVVSEFVLQSRYYVHFRANTFEKGMKPLSSQLWVKYYHYCSSRRRNLALNNLKRVDMPLNKTNQTNQTGRTKFICTLFHCFTYYYLIGIFLFSIKHLFTQVNCFKYWYVTNNLLTVICSHEFKVRFSRGVMVKTVDCRMVVSEFDFLLHDYVHFRTSTVGKGMKPTNPPSYGLKSSNSVFLEGLFGIKY